MRKISILLIVCALLALSACQGSAPESQGAGAPVSGGQTAEIPAPEAAPIPADSAPPADPEIVLPPLTGDVVEIKEKMFIAQYNDIYLNTDDYLGKTIKLEGMLTQYTWAVNGQTYYFVYRWSPGCCGDDGIVGFEVSWPEGSDEAYPNEDDWVEAVGVLEEYEEEGYSYLRLALSSLIVLPTRGAEFVSQ